MPVNDEEVVRIMSCFKDRSTGRDELKPDIIKKYQRLRSNVTLVTGFFPMRLKLQMLFLYIRRYIRP